MNWRQFEVQNSRSLNSERNSLKINYSKSDLTLVLLVYVGLFFHRGFQVQLLGVVVVQWMAEEEQAVLVI